MSESGWRDDLKCYAVRLDGVFFLAYAESAAQAKGLVLKRAQRVYRRIPFKTLACRLWRGLEGATHAHVEDWGTPGERDWETGAYIGTPTPFEER